MKKGDIVLFKFPFSNMIGYKKRPCIVLSQNINNDVILCQVISIKPEENYITIINKCFDNKSYIKINKITTVDVSKIDSIIGSIDDKEYKLLVDKISKLMTK